MISVIINYNKDRGYLKEAIESYHAQTLPESQRELILSYNPDKSGSANLNEGIRKSKGDYIKYLSEDDLLTPNCLEDSLKAIQGYDFIHGNAFNFDGNLSTKVFEAWKPPFKSPTVKDLTGSNWCIHGGTLMYSRELIERVGWFDETLTDAEELDYNIRCLIAGGRLGYCDSFLYYYRWHDKQSRSVEDQAARQRRINAVKNKYK